MATEVTTYPPVEDGLFTTTFIGTDPTNRLKGMITFDGSGQTNVEYFYVSVVDPSSPAETSDFVRDSQGNIVFLAKEIIQRFFHHLAARTGLYPAYDGMSFEQFLDDIRASQEVDDNGKRLFLDGYWAGPFEIHDNIQRLMS